MTGPRRVASMVGLMLTCAGCADGPVDVAFSVLSAPGTDPFAGASAIDVVVEQRSIDAQEMRVVAEARLPADAVTLEVGPLPLGEGFAIRVDAVEGDTGLVLGRGRSFPFDVTRDGASPRPDVLVGAVGRFATPIDTGPDSDLAAAVAIEGGALLVASSGRLSTYAAHGDPSGHASLTEVSRLPGRAGAEWVPIGGRALLAVGGASGGLSAVDVDGEVLDSRPESALPDHRDGAAVVGLSDGSVIIAGGAPSADAPPTDRVSRVSLLSDGTLAIEDIPSARLPFAVRDATGLAVPVRVGASSVAERVVLLFGQTESTPRTEVVMIDPDGSSPARTLDLAVSRQGAAAAVLDVGLLLVAGGIAQDGTPSDEVRLLSARPEALSLVSPAPDPLFEARSDAAVISMGSRLLLLAGGRGLGGVPLTSAEIVDTRFFPPDVVPTGPLPLSLARPRGVLMADGSVLLGGAGALAIYFPPRSL